jgi:hypothetical protein
MIVLMKPCPVCGKPPVEENDDTVDELLDAMRTAGLVSPYKATFDGQRLVLTAPGAAEFEAKVKPAESSCDGYCPGLVEVDDALGRCAGEDRLELLTELNRRALERDKFSEEIDLLAKVRDDIAVAVGFKLIDTGSWTNDSVIAAVKRLVQERDDAVADRATVERTRDRLFNERDGATSYLRSNLSEGDRAETLIGCCRAVTERLKQTTKERDYNASEIRRVMVERESLREQCDRDEETIETLNRDNARKAEAVRKANAERDGFREAAAKANEELVAINEACDAPPGTRLVRWAATLKKERDEAIRQAEDHETLRGRVEALEAGFAKLRRDDELKAIR